MFTRKYLVKAKFKDVVVALNDKDKDLFNSNRSINFPVPGIPFLEIIRYSGTTNGGYSVIHKIFTDVSKLPTSKNIQETESQVERLAALGLIDVGFGISLLPVSSYDHLEHGVHVTKLVEDNNKHNLGRIEKIRGKICLTTLGKDFLSIVLKQKDSTDGIQK